MDYGLWHAWATDAPWIWNRVKNGSGFKRVFGKSNQTSMTPFRRARLRFSFFLYYPRHLSLYPSCSCQSMVPLSHGTSCAKGIWWDLLASLFCIPPQSTLDGFIQPSPCEIFLFGTSDVFTAGPGVLVRFSWMVILSFTGGHWRGLCSVLVHFLFYSCFSIQRSPVIMFYSLWLKNAIWFLFQHFPIVGPPALLAILRLTSHHPASLVNVFNRQQLISSC